MRTTRVLVVAWFFAVLSVLLFIAAAFGMQLGPVELAIMCALAIGLTVVIVRFVRRKSNPRDRR